MLRDDLPEIYQQILPEDFLALSPIEQKATCNDCYKSKSHAPKPHYNAQLKCCTYYPFIPNYLVGAILAAEPGANQPTRAQATLRELLKDRRYVLPIGVCAPPGYQMKFTANRSVAFGKDADLLCPFFEYQTGHCGVWRHRGHECATFFCASSYGTNGESFWSEVRDFLHFTEMHLSQEAMLFKGFSSQEIDLNLKFIRFDENASETKGPAAWSMTALDWSSIWAHHLEDTEEYFKATFAFVKDHAKVLKKQVSSGSSNRSDSKKVDTRVLRNYLVGRTVSKNHRVGQSAQATPREI